MHLIVKILILFIGLTSCTTQRIEIKINKNSDSEPTTEYVSKSEPLANLNTEAIEDIETNIQGMRYKIEKSIIDCPKFELPSLASIPTIPKDIQNKKRMSDEELITILTEYARQLRKVSIENQAAIQAKYKQYIEMCKK